MFYSLNRPKRLPIIPVITSALRIYNDHCQTYFLLSVRATFWAGISMIFFFNLLTYLSFLPFILFQFIYCFTTNQHHIFSSIYSSCPIELKSIIINCVVTVISFMLSIYFISKFCINCALISKLAYQELISQPNSVLETWRKIKSIRWLCWRTSFYICLILSIIDCILSAVNYFILVLINWLTITESISFVLSLIASILIFFIGFWFSARYFISDIIPVIEEWQVDGATIAIDRSWRLTKGFATKIMLIIFGYWLIIIPVYLLSITPLVMTFISNLSIWQDLSSIHDYINAFIIFGSYLLISIILFLIINIIVIPLSQCIKAVIYYDLSSRIKTI